MCAATALVTSLLVPAAVATPTPVAPETVDAEVTCTNPPPPGNLGGLTPTEVADHYGITPLRDAGFDGRGLTAVVIETGDSVDERMLAQWQACFNLPRVPVVQTVIGGGDLPPAGDEAQADAQVLTSLAPGIGSLYVLIIPRGKAFGQGWVEVLEAMLDGSVTGGRRPDLVSMSVGQCERLWEQAEVDRSEELLQQLAESGTWFIKSAGDAGSSDCAPHGDCSAVTNADRVLATEYPTTSPWMTAVGGTEFADVNRPVVWFNQSKCSGGGGGTSSLIARPDWQTDLTAAGAALGPAAVGGGRLIPDLAALAGTPGYIVLEPPKAGRPAGWVADGGTSLATPAYAAGFAIVRQALLAGGVTPPVLLNPELYRLAAASGAPSVFNDVTEGTNDLFGLGCCDAGVGFDLASGWGEVNFTGLHAALGGAPLPRPTPVVPDEPVGPRFTG